MKKLLHNFLFICLALFQMPIQAAPLSDQEINNIIEKLLVKENDIPNTEISVTTKNKIVKLTGTVDTKLQLYRIVELASSVKSVADIDAKDLKIRNSKEFLSDAFITAKAKGKIKYLAMSKHISNKYNLHVETTNQVVHIFGEVDKKKDIDAISSSINSMIDVNSVKMNIKCKKSKNKDV